MRTIIDADAAKLAGLQIDTLQKLRSGQITIGQWERFNNLSMGDREKRFGGGEEPESNKTKLTNCTDDCFSIVEDFEFTTPTEVLSKKLEPGKTYRGRFFQNIESVSSEDFVAFLQRKRAIFVDGQDLNLVQKLKPGEFPLQWILAFAEEGILQCADGRHMVPSVYGTSNHVIYFEYEPGWSPGFYILCVSDLSVGTDG